MRIDAEQAAGIARWLVNLSEPDTLLICYQLLDDCRTLDELAEQTGLTPSKLADRLNAGQRSGRFGYRQHQGQRCYRIVCPATRRLAGLLYRLYETDGDQT